MNKEKIEDYARQIHVGRGEIYKRTLKNADYILFKGKLALEVYEYIKEQQGQGYSFHNACVMVPILKKDAFTESTIELVSVGSNIRLVFEKNDDKIFTPTLYKERESDYIWTISVKE